MIVCLLILTRADDAGRLTVDIKWESMTFGLRRPLVQDLDNSYVVKIGEMETYKVVVKAIQDRFWEYDARRRDKVSVWRWHHERHKRTGSELHSESFVTHDEVGNSIARQILDFIYENRLALGDDGDWHVWTCRDLALGRAGIDLADLALREQQTPAPKKPLHKADYTDALDSYRFPSLSCLGGVSQSLSRLHGAETFRKLFIQDGPGIYIAFDDDAALYIGMSQCLSQRLSNAAGHHKLKPILQRHPEARVAVIYYPYWKLPAIDDVVTIEDENVVWVRIRELLYGFERACIGHYQPCYNGILLGEQPKD